jgi:hypothetical protein
MSKIKNIYIGFARKSNGKIHWTWGLDVDDYSNAPSIIWWSGPFYLKVVKNK